MANPIGKGRNTATGQGASAFRECRQHAIAALRGRGSGFSLIELLAALAVLAVIAMLAVPLYTSYSQRAFRSEVQGDLLACALGMERWAGTGFTYAGAADTDGDGDGDADSGPVAASVCNARSAAQGRYAITVEGSVDTFRLIARPESGGPMAEDGFLELDAAGNRRWDRDDNGVIGTGEDRWE